MEGGALADILLVDMQGGWNSFALLRIDPTGYADHENTQLFGHESPKDIVHKFVFLADDRNIKSVWVNGRKVKNTMEAILPQ